MRDPSREEQRDSRVGDIGRIESGRSEKFTYVVKRHHDHDDAAQNIDRLNARSFGYYQWWTPDRNFIADQNEHQPVGRQAGPPIYPG
jgi:hypothetical protein